MLQWNSQINSLTETSLFPQQTLSQKFPLSLPDSAGCPTKEDI